MSDIEKELLAIAKKHLSIITNYILSGNYIISLIYEDGSKQKFTTIKRCKDKMISDLKIKLDASYTDMEARGIYFLKIDNSRTKAARTPLAFDKLMNYQIDQFQKQEALIKNCITNIERFNSVTRDMLFSYLILSDLKEKKQHYINVHGKSERTYQRNLNKSLIQYAIYSEESDIEKILAEFND